MLPQKLTWDLASTQWAQQINPVLANLLIQGNFIKNQALIDGTTVINHGLGRAPLGWFLVAPQAAATVYQAASQPNPTLQLSLTSNAAVTTGIWVF